MEQYKIEVFFPLLTDATNKMEQAAKQMETIVTEGREKFLPEEIDRMNELIGRINDSLLILNK